MFLNALGLPVDTSKASKRTVLNGTALDWSTKDAEVGHGHYKLGMEIDRQSDGNFVWKTWTVENSSHVLNSKCVITKEGKLLDGTVNCFGLGWMPLDQGYVDQLLEEYSEGPSSRWDEVK